MKAVGVAGVGSVIASSQVLAQSATPEPAAAAAPSASVPQMPLHPFGKTGVKVPMLGLGGIFDIAANQLVLQRALDFGVTYWDTASGYTNGNSEKGIGMYFEKNPEVRKRIFLVTKASGPHSPEGLTATLQESLQRMKTDHIDLYFLHGIRGGHELTDEIKGWAEKAKAANKIRFFGFSTHGGMEGSLQEAARLGWVDAIMLKYDYRLMRTDEMRAAMDACHQAGVGLTAMKTQGGGPFRPNDEADNKLAAHFIQRGFTPHQAKVKAVWENPQVACVCSQMSNLNVLESNVAAALDKTKLTAADHAALKQYAADTRSRFCAGCAQRCEGALQGAAPVADLMRCLMYHRHYGDRELALSVFRSLPAETRSKLPVLDFTPAEEACPHRLPIGDLMRQASRLLG